MASPSELAHGVANNFGRRSSSLKPTSERRARTLQRGMPGEGNRHVWTASFSWMNCAMILVPQGRAATDFDKCKADALPLCMDQAAPSGSNRQRAVKNAIKHAFPDGRPGRVRVSLEAHSEKMKLCVEDNSVGLRPRTSGDTGMGKDLVAGLASQLGGQLDSPSTRNGCSFRVSIPHSPYASPDRSTQSAQSTPSSFGAVDSGGHILKTEGAFPGPAASPFASAWLASLGSERQRC